jgi:hypothetical protein
VSSKGLTDNELYGGVDRATYEQHMRLARRRNLEAAKGRHASSSRSRFAQVPLAWAARAAKATGTPRALVWIWLLYLVWDKGSRTVPLANATLQSWGISRHTKWRALQDLEKAKLIRIKRRPRRAPQVTIL